MNIAPFTAANFSPFGWLLGKPIQLEATNTAFTNVVVGAATGIIIYSLANLSKRLSEC